MRFTRIVTEKPLDTIDLADGRRMVIRPTTSDDGERIRALYQGLTEDDRHRRFFGAFNPRSAWCRAWASVGDRGGFGVIALVEDPGSGPEPGDEVVAGEAGYAMRPDGDGDLAVTVAADWRGWLGPYLLDLLVEHAAAAGVANLQAEVMLQNSPMLSLLRRRDPIALEHDDGIVRLSISTTGTTASWPPEDHRPRVLVEIAGRRWSGERLASAAGLSTAMCAGPDGRVGHPCPVLEGGTCPLADDAEAILVLLDPDDERSRQLAASHRRRVPDRPVFVRTSAGRDPQGCVGIAEDSGEAVAQLLGLIGQSS
jgi:ribosomal protein S18 acetylase RimI-like enzyme